MTAVGPGIDLRDPGLPRALHGAFSSLQSDDPVHALRDGVWLLTRYDDVAAVLKDRARCGTDIHSKRGYDDERPFGAGSALETFQEGLLVNLGAADHRRVRGAFGAPFTRAAVEASVVSVVARHASALLAALPDSGVVDWVAEVAQPLPALVFAELFDLPVADLAWLLERLHEDTVAFDVLLDPALVGPVELARGQQAMLELRTYLEQLAVVRLQSPGDDMLSLLVRAHVDGLLSWDDVLTQAMEALAAGTSTTQTLLSGMLEAFASEPSAWDVVAADPGVLVRPAVEEALRWVSPALAMGRIALSDFSLRGRAIAAGDVLQCAVLVANRDPRAFDDPERFDVTRSPNRHLAFGGGVHTCLGAHIARVEAAVVLERAVARWQRIEVDAEGTALHPTLMIRTFRSMAVRLVAR
jgi:pimeloyl-[acyl-carrier protein] synthase